MTDINELLTTRRWVYYVDPSQTPDPVSGFMPSIVFEGESGHFPLKGNGEGSAPWRWGSLEQAEETAKHENEMRGFDGNDVAEIILSSMGAKT